MNSSTDTASTKRRYIVCFHDSFVSRGYYLVENLGSGANAITSLVIDGDDGQTRVRKVNKLRMENTTSTYQSGEVRNFIPHTHIPWLRSSRDYPLVVRDNTLDPQNSFQQVPGPMLPRRFIEAATVWDFCNGGTLHDLFYRMNNNYLPSHQLPEACIWSFFSNMLGVLMFAHQVGVAHTDTHSSNWFLHWPSQQDVFPQIFLGDWGNSVRFPSFADPEFTRPFIGDLDQTRRTLPHSLSDDDTYSIMKWYRRACADMQSALQLLYQFIVIGRTVDRPDTPLANRDGTRRTFILDADQRGVGEAGYSPQLIHQLAVWENLANLGHTNPLAFLAQLNRLKTFVDQCARLHLQHYIANPSLQILDQSIIRQIATVSGPALWKDPTDLLNPTLHRDSYGNFDQYDASQNLTEYVEAHDDGLYELEQQQTTVSPPPPLQGNITLRQGNYSVLAVDVNTQTGMITIQGPVHSLADIDPLSPTVPSPAPPPPSPPPSSPSSMQAREDAQEVLSFRSFQGKFR